MAALKIFLEILAALRGNAPSCPLNIILKVHLSVAPHMVDAPLALAYPGLKKFVRKIVFVLT